MSKEKKELLFWTVIAFIMIFAISVLMAIIVPFVIGLADYNINSFVSFCNGYVCCYILWKVDND